MDYLVGTGARYFPVTARTPEGAIRDLKRRIMARLVRPDDQIGMSLVDALEAHRLSFVVTDTGRTQLISGELNWTNANGIRLSRFEPYVTRRLAAALARLMSPRLWDQSVDEEAIFGSRTSRRRRAGRGRSQRSRN